MSIIEPGLANQLLGVENRFPPLGQAFVMVLATPDFGAGAAANTILLLVWAIVLLFVVVGIAWGLWLRKSGTPKDRLSGAILIVVCGLVPLSCCIGPSLAVRLTYGNFPLGSYPSGRVREGMTAEQVVAALGTPHERHKKDDGESWYYWLDSFGINWFGVQFGPDGRVTQTHGN